MNKPVKTLIDVLLLLLLLLACILPGVWLNRVCDGLSEQIRLTCAALEAGADHTPYLRELERRYERAAPRMKLFMDHAAVDELGGAISVCGPITEEETLRSSLNAVQAAIVHLCDSESLRWDSMF